MAVYEDMRNDFTKVLSEWNNAITITRTTETKGSMGEVISTSDTSYTINCIIQQITEKDRDIHAIGLAEPGNRKVFFKYQYDSSDDSDISGTFTPAAGDKITDADSNCWRIEQIVHRARRGDNIIFIKTVARRLE